MRLRVAISLGVLLGACASPLSASAAPVQTTQATTPASEKKVPRHNVPFIYYLANLNRQLLIKINPAVAVIDPYDSGLKEGDVGWLQRRYGMKIYAYLSIGEIDPNRTSAHDGYAFREEWRKESWMTRVPVEVRENTQWDSRRVEYWAPEWRALMLYRIRRLAELGYDGVMFDTVDSYVALDPYYRRDIKQDMADLIGFLKREARKVKPDFKVMINNGMELYDYKDSRSGEPILDIIDAQLKESTWYDEQGVIQESWTESDLAYLRRALDAKKPMFAVDYFTNEKVPVPHKLRLSDFMLKARAFGAIPFAADRGLGKYLIYNEEYFKSHFSWDSSIKAGVLPEDE